MSTINFKVLGEIVNEQWKPIRGYEGLYEVSNMGRVKSLDQVSYRSNGITMCYIRQKGRLLKGRLVGSKKKKQYLGVLLCRNGKQENKKIHRLVAEAFIPNPNNYPQIDHIDGNKTNNTVSNLEWVTNEENMRRSWEKGLRSYCGENSPRAKLTQSEVDEIRNTYVPGVRGFGRKSLAKKYHVSENAIKAITEGRTWIRS
jgi:hypothetical protein